MANYLKKLLSFISQDVISLGYFSKNLLKNDLWIQ